MQRRKILEKSGSPLSSEIERKTLPLNLRKNETHCTYVSYESAYESILPQKTLNTVSTQLRNS